MTFIQYLKDVQFNDPKITYNREMRLRRKLFVAVQCLKDYVEDRYIVDGFDMGTMAEDALDQLYERKPLKEPKKKKKKKKKEESEPESISDVLDTL